MSSSLRLPSTIETTVDMTDEDTVPNMPVGSYM